MLDHYPEIRLLLRHEIDDACWNQAIGNSLQSRIYGYTFWLDVLSPGWSALVYKNYVAVMPLPVKKKYGVCYLAQPFFTQQLGIFSSTPPDDGMYNAFIRRGREQFRFAEICLNGPSFITDAVLRKNYILPLTKSYETIYRQFSKSLVSNSLKPLKKLQLVYTTENSTEQAIDTYRKHYNSRLHIPSVQYTRLKALALNLKENDRAFTRTVYRYQGEPLATSLFFIDRGRIYNLLSTTTPEGRRLNANYFLYDQLIQEFAGREQLLDFEGSNVPGIEQFYKKFGAVLEPYHFLKWNLLKWPYRLFKS